MSKLRNIGSKWPSSALTLAVPGSARSPAVLDPLAVAAIAHSLGGGLVPEVTAGRPGGLVVSAFRRIRNAAIAPVAQRPEPLDEIGRIGAHRPFMAVGADLALDVEVVEQHEFTRQGVMVGRDRLGKQAEVRVAVALLHIAEDLVISPVFLDRRRPRNESATARPPSRGSGCPARGLRPSRRSGLLA